VSPTTLNLSTEVGDALGVTVGLDFRPGISTSTFKVVDPSGRFASAVAATNNGGGHYSLGLTVLPPAATGTFSGTIGLRLCGSADCIASADLAGSPLQVAYTLTVSPYTGLVSPPTASGLPEWETFQGNAAHTGFVPVTLDPARFAQRWQWTMPATLNGSPSPVTTGSGVALVSSASYFQPATLFALDEADGSVKWSHDFGSIFAANHPATGGGRAFVATSGHADTFMWSFDLLTGEQKFKTQFDSQWEHYLAPVFRNGYVYTDGGPYGGMFRFKAATGTRSWFGSLGQYDLWSPAVDDNRAYAYTGYMMSALDVNTGIPVRSISDPTFNWRGYALNLSPVLPGDGSVLVVNGIYAFPQPSRNELVRFDMDAGTAMWRMQGMFASNPVVDGNTVFVANSSTRQLEARSLADGTLLWAWQPESGTETLPVGNLVLTRNLVFVSTSAATRAIDRTTHQVVWSAPQLGALAISSNSVLYISNTSQTSGPARTVTSYSLQ
jgi:outer membrane protein assembly factor BamB